MNAKNEYLNFKEYKPEVLPEGAPNDARFYSDDKDNDWYELMYQFDKTSWKIGYQQNGYVVWATKDVVGTYSPAGLSVAVVASVPTGKERMREDIWFYEKGKVVVKTEDDLYDRLTVATQKKSQLTDEANERILILERAVKYDIATADEKDALEAWEKYSVYLNRFDVNSWPDNDFPEKPADVA